ncbi:MAG: hypothetical protein COV10_04090 [Candidatus Vogelbacteria bacterium CG10_big_fil_rev_8_21_14_0_10_51_16]|uniref:AB hydrolase-1 domain-containing protein n=1 Tax=Candidatus Vogelbacteria bacterium CG10_big_fil_rev_8_21_14_0_10_51_16 TaxID=1975045 RepID=A0A2H0RDM1_9BACT|nr:MAG: hypothetical protein COV10_04090 [Candidatus Vogelbacteria bacterium CG10_big_fil_rev_8_21_14_0_10_51_16]
MIRNIVTIIVILVATGAVWVFRENTTSNAPAEESSNAQEREEGNQAQKIAGDNERPRETPEVEKQTQAEEPSNSISGIVVESSENIAINPTETATPSASSDDLPATPAQPEPPAAPAEEQKQPTVAPEPKPAVVNSATTFTCENDRDVESRAYVLVLGINNNNDPTGAQTWIDGATAGDIKNSGNLVFAYDKSRSLVDLSADFINRFNSFVDGKKPEEVVVIGWSAGGVIAASQAHRLQVPGSLEIHTVASPLKGYSLGGFLEFLLEEQTGFGREIGLGFGPFLAPPANARVYHHKTVTDSDLSGRCGDFASFCNPRIIQANNLAGAKEFYYPQYDHEPIMHAVAEMVVACRK